MAGPAGAARRKRAAGRRGDPRGGARAGARQRPRRDRVDRSGIPAPAARRPAPLSLGAAPVPRPASRQAAQAPRAPGARGDAAARRGARLGRLHRMARRPRRLPQALLRRAKRRRESGSQVARAASSSRCSSPRRRRGRARPGSLQQFRAAGAAKGSPQGDGSACAASTGTMPKQRHRLRIEVKRLRYATDFLGGKTQALERLQDALGELNDLAVTRRSSRSLRPPASLLREGWQRASAGYSPRCAGRSLRSSRKTDSAGQAKGSPGKAFSSGAPRFARPRTPEVRFAERCRRACSRMRRDDIEAVAARARARARGSWRYSGGQPLHRRRAARRADWSG